MFSSQRNNTAIDSATTCGGNYRSRRLASNLAILLLLPVALAGSLTGSVVGQIHADWFSGLGAWNDANQWENGVGVPNNSATDFFNVVIDSNPSVQSVVTLPSHNHITIDSLSLNVGDELVIEHASSFHVVHDAARASSGMIANAGTIFLNSEPGLSELLIETDVTLQGGGSIVMTGLNAFVGDKLSSANGYLSNHDNTIAGEGKLGLGRTRITNAGMGTIDANVNGGALEVDTAASVDFVNQGTLQARNGGILRLLGRSANSIDNTGGTIQALNGGTVQLENNVSIRNGTLLSSGTGNLILPSFESATLTDVTIQSAIQIQNNTNLLLKGTINNHSLLVQGADTGAARIAINGSASLAGGGEIAMSGAGASVISHSFGHLTNIDNVIHGRGILGTQMQLSNLAAGLIDANVSGESLLINTPNGSDLLNDGVMRASNGGVLSLNGFTGQLLNSNGEIQALDNSRVEMRTRVSITGGTISAVGSGQLEIAESSRATLTDLSIQGQLDVLENSTLAATGAIENTDRIHLSGAKGLVQILSETTLLGGGTITMSGVDSRILKGPFTGSTIGHLENVDNLIEGQGAIGDGLTRVTNRFGGLIDANLTGQSLTMETRNGSDLVNEGIMRASNGGILRFTKPNDLNVNNTGGSIEALTNGQVEFEGVTVVGGRLAADSTGRLQISSGKSASLRDLTIAGRFDVQSNANLFLYGDINNDASVIHLDGTSLDSRIRILSDTNLTGGGSITMAGPSAMFLKGSFTGSGFGNLTNVDNRIEGQGQIGFGNIQLTNLQQGVVDANVAGATLAIAAQNAATGIATAINHGTFRASGGGTLRLIGDNKGEYAGTGIFEALDASAVVFDSAAIVQNIDGAGNLTSGTWRSIDSGNSALITVENQATSLITNIGLSATVELSGVNSGFVVAGTALDESLASNHGNLILRDGRVLDSSNAIDNFGHVTIDGGATALQLIGQYHQTGGITELIDGALLSTSLADFDGGELMGNGVVDGLSEFALASVIAPGQSAGILQFNDDTMVAGSLEIELGGALVNGLSQDIALINSTTDFGNIDFDQINILGNGVLADGTLLEISLIDGFRPEVGSFFDVLTGGSLMIGNIDLSGPGGIGFERSVLNLSDATFGGSRDVLRLTVISSVPEPGSLAVLACVLLAISFRRSRMLGSKET